MSNGLASYHILSRFCTASELFLNQHGNKMFSHNLSASLPLFFSRYCPLLVKWNWSLYQQTYYHVILWASFTACTNKTIHYCHLSPLCRRWPYRGVLREQSWFSNVSKVSKMILLLYFELSQHIVTVVKEQFTVHIVVPILLSVGVFFIFE